MLKKCCMVLLFLSSLWLFTAACVVDSFGVVLFLFFIVLSGVSQCCVSFDDLSIREEGKIFYPVCYSKIRRYCSLKFCQEMPHDNGIGHNDNIPNVSS